MHSNLELQIQPRRCGRAQQLSIAGPAKERLDALSHMQSAILVVQGSNLLMSVSSQTLSLTLSLCVCRERHTHAQRGRDALWVISVLSAAAGLATTLSGLMSSPGLMPSCKSIQYGVACCCSTRPTNIVIEGIDNCLVVSVPAWSGLRWGQHCRKASTGC